MVKRFIQAGLILVVVLLLGAISAHAQTATPTPTASPTPTMSPSPTPTPVIANGGRAICVTVTTSQTQVLKARVNSTQGRQRLCLQNVGTANIAACNIGNTTPVTISTGIILPFQPGSGGSPPVPPLCFGRGEYSSQTFAIAPGGQVNCIASAASTVVCALEY